jgi:hypothetical protein
MRLAGRNHLDRAMTAHPAGREAWSSTSRSTAEGKDVSAPASVPGVAGTGSPGRTDRGRSARAGLVPAVQWRHPVRRRGRTASWRPCGRTRAPWSNAPCCHGRLSVSGKPDVIAESSAGPGEPSLRTHAALAAAAGLRRRAVICRTLRLAPGWPLLVLGWPRQTTGNLRSRGRMERAGRGRGRARPPRCDRARRAWRTGGVCACGPCALTGTARGRSPAWTS